MKNYKLKIHDWERWQTYRKDRGQPPWIKIHRTLLRDLKWIKLTDAERGQLIMIWMLAADDNGEIPDDPDVIRKLCCMDKTPDLERFIDVGFIDRRQHDVSVTSQRRQHDHLETETETETETDTFVPSEADSTCVKFPPVERLKTKNGRLVYPKEFDEFWKAYPSRTGGNPKKPAYQKWRVAVHNGTTHGKIKTGLNAYVQANDQNIGTQYIPMASVWLNQRRWEDDYSVVLKSQANYSSWDEEE